MSHHAKERVRQMVREGYTKIARETSGGCCSPGVSCCGSTRDDAGKPAGECGTL